LCIAKGILYPENNCVELQNVIILTASGTIIIVKYERFILPSVNVEKGCFPLSLVDLGVT